MFSFVLWDRIGRKAFAARDRLGIKPLCWAMHDGALILSSTLEPFNKLLGADRKFDLVALRDLMAFDYIPVPRTIFQGVHKLEPGSRLEWRWGAKEPTIDRYWRPPMADERVSVPDEFELEQLLENAVGRQMISDVPIGAFLSGGIDSSLLVAMMARRSSKPVRTFSVAFDDEKADESCIAAQVAQHFGTDHTVLRAEEFGPAKLLRLLGDLDEPFCDATLVPTYALSLLTKQYVKVALSGDGGDEIFGGYTKYLLPQNHRGPVPFSSWFDYALRKLSWRPRGMGHIYRHTLSLSNEFSFTSVCYGDFPIFRKDLKQLLLPQHHECAEIAHFFEPWNRRAQRYGDRMDTDMLLRTDLETYLSENCLVKTDRASMLASLEVRVPFLDELILDRILPLPASAKIIDGKLKALLMPLARRLLPKEVWNRPKHGFNVPVDTQLSGAWRPAVEEVLEWGETHVDVFDYQYLRRIHAISLSEGGVSGELWNPFVFLAWAKARFPQ
jgi:asparagine synthase (glutamine-hydrolysing)